MVFSAAAYDAEAAFCQCLSQHGSIGFHLLGIVFPRRLQVFTEAYSLGCNDVLERTALYSWENGRVKQLAHLLQFALFVGQSPWVIEVFTH